jgi:hypothetical protein
MTPSFAVSEKIEKQYLIFSAPYLMAGSYFFFQNHLTLLFTFIVSIIHNNSKSNTLVIQRYKALKIEDLKILVELTGS